MINGEGRGLPSTVPDGGWGWAIVAGVAITNMFNQSVCSLFGLLFGEHLQHMNHGTTGAALITNLNSLFLNFSGLLIGPAIKNFAPRTVAFIGCLLTSFGLMMCSVSTQLWHLIIFYSLFVGLGLGLIAPSTFMAINAYFKEKRGFAVGIALAGTGVGQMFMPHVVRILLDNYGFQTTIIIVGALALHGLIGASLFRPVDKYIQKPNQNLKEVKLLLDLKPKEEKSQPEIEIKIINNSNEVNNFKIESKAKTLCHKIFERVIKAMDLELLTDPVFVSICLGMGLVYTATTNFSMLYPYVLQNSVGLSRKDTAFCMSVLAFADILSRLLLPLVTDKLKIPYRIVFLFGTFGLLCSRSILAESYEFLNIVIMSAFCGSVKAATVVNNNLTITEHCKPEKLAGGLGLNMISKGILVISVGQFLGWFRDYTKSYSLCIHAQNLLLLIVILFWLPELIYKYYKSKKDNKSDKLENSIS